MSGNERGKGMREEIQTFIHYMEEEKQASKNTTLSYQRDLLKMADYLEENNYQINRIAVEMNEEILPKYSYSETMLKDGDRLEVVTFVGGG